MLNRGGKRYGMEFKFQEAPAATRSMHTAIKDLDLKHLWVVYPGRHRFPIDARITAWPLSQITALAQEF